jgi:hypothetical protein
MPVPAAVDEYLFASQVQIAETAALDARPACRTTTRSSTASDAWRQPGKIHSIRAPMKR